VQNLIVYVFSISIVFYAGKITQYSPVYFIYIVAIIAYLPQFFKHQKIILTADVAIIFIFLVYLLVSQYEHYYTGEFVNIVIGMMAYLIIRVHNQHLKLNFLLKVFKHMLLISIIILMIDSVYRISNPTANSKELFEYLSSSDQYWFYIYKFNSILFADSNTVALVALVLYFSILSLEIHIGEAGINFKYMKYALILIIILSFSRSGLLALFFGLLYYKYHKSKKIIKIKTLFYSVIILIIFYIYIWEYFISDGSFISKLEIYDNVYAAGKNFAIFDSLFGIGLGESKYALSRYTHILFLTIIVEVGFTGLLFFLFFIMSYGFKYNLVVLMPILIAGLSYFLYIGTPFLFVPLALVANILDKSKKIQNLSL
jgi:hypothetical protein